MSKNLMPSVLIYLEADPDTPLGPIQTDNRDAVRWDRARGQKKWPPGSEAPLLWLTFLAWSAAKRTGQFAGSYDDFEAACIRVGSADDAEDADGEDAELDPTQ